MQEGQFQRVVRRKEVMALSFGAMIGWGWVALTGDWISGAGSAGAVAAFLVGGLVITLVGLTYAELSSALPMAGGEHVYSRRALGPASSFVCTWSILFGYVSVVAFEAVALPTVISHLTPSLDTVYLWSIAGWDVHLIWVLVGVLGAVLITAFNFFGIEMAARLQLIMLVLVGMGGLTLVAGASYTGVSDNLKPFFINGFEGIAGVIIMVPFMFVGFDIVAQSAEEIDLPFQQIGKIIVVSIISAVVWYILIIWAVSMGASETLLRSSEVPSAEAANALFGSPAAGKIIVLAGIGGLLTSWNGFMIGGSRAIYAMAKARQLPAIFGELHPKHRTPHNAVLFIGLISIIAPFFGKPALVWLVNAGALGIVVAYIFVVTSFLVLRYREPSLERPFKVRRWRLVGGTALLLSTGLFCLYLPGSPAALAWPNEWAIVLIWVLLGVAFFFNPSARPDPEANR